MRRYDLIPNLVETCKGYMAHERETLDAVIKARNQAAGAAQTASANPGNAAAMQGLQQADGALAGVLGRMFALAEAYPDLKANQNMLGLQEELTSTKTRFRLHARATTIRSWNTHQARILPRQHLRGYVRVQRGGIVAGNQIRRGA